MGFIDPWLYFERGAGLTASCLPGQVQDRGLHVLQQVHFSYSQGFILIYWAVRLASILTNACLIHNGTL